MPLMAQSWDTLIFPSRYYKSTNPFLQTWPWHENKTIVNVIPKRAPWSSLIFLSYKRFDYSRKHEQWNPLFKTPDLFGRHEQRIKAFENFMLVDKKISHLQFCTSSCLYSSVNKLRKEHQPGSWLLALTWLICFAVVGKTQSLHCKKGSFKQVILHRLRLSHFFLFPTVLKINAPTITSNRQIVL